MPRRVNPRPSVAWQSGRDLTHGFASPPLDGSAFSREEGSPLCWTLGQATCQSAQHWKQETCDPPAAAHHPLAQTEVDGRGRNRLSQQKLEFF